MGGRCSLSRRLKIYIITIEHTPKSEILFGAFLFNNHTSMGDLYDKYHSYFQVFPITLIHKPIKLYCDENKNDVHSSISIDNSIQ